VSFSDVDVHRSGAEVAIAVVSWNTRALLVDCLSSLHDDAHDGRAEVWVVDNSSSDGSADMVRERFPWVHLIASPENLGFGPAVNLVAARSSTPWIAPANADVRLKPDALRRLLETGGAHPDAAAIAPRLILPDDSTQRSVYPFPTLPFTLAYVTGATTASRRLARYWCMEGGFDPEHGREIWWAVGAFLLVRRTAWNAVGGFDDAQWMYAEDLDLGWRLRRAGWTARYEPTAEVFHAESAATTQAWGEERHDRWHASTYAWMARRRGLHITRAVAWTHVMGFGLRAAAHTPAAAIGNSRARAARRAALNTARAHAVGLRSRQQLEQVR
jgi:N-acetylglucosaminyl-diphospho-decaprenol L-rhamnosyltransferase